MAYPTAVLTLAPYGGASRTTTLPSVTDILLGPVTYHPVTTTDYGYPYNDGGPTTTTCLSDSISNLDLSIPDGYGDPTRTTLLSNSRSDGIWTQDDQGSNTAVTTSRLSGTITKNNTIMSTIFAPGVSVGSPEPFPPRLSSNARLIMGISLGSLVQIVLLADLYPPFIQRKPELDANGQWRHEMPTDRQEGPFELEAVDMRHWEECGKN